MEEFLSGRCRRTITTFLFSMISGMHQQELHYLVDLDDIIAITLTTVHRLTYEMPIARLDMCKHPTQRPKRPRMPCAR
jgi:hypothetical protein